MPVRKRATCGRCGGWLLKSYCLEAIRGSPGRSRSPRPMAFATLDCCMLQVMSFRLPLLSVVAAAVALLAQQYTLSLYNGMRWRQVGPFRAGRISAVAGVPGD